MNTWTPGESKTSPHTPFSPGRKAKHYQATGKETWWEGKVAPERKIWGSAGKQACSGLRGPWLSTQSQRLIMILILEHPKPKKTAISSKAKQVWPEATPWRTWRLLSPEPTLPNTLSREPSPSLNSQTWVFSFRFFYQNLFSGTSLVIVTYILVKTITYAHNMWTLDNISNYGLKGSIPS